MQRSNQNGYISLLHISNQRQARRAVLICTFLSIAGCIFVACDDDPPSLEPADPRPAGSQAGMMGGEIGSGISGGADGGDMSAGSIAGEETSGTQAGAEPACEVSCSDVDTCASLNCLCPDGRTASFEGCQEGCCLSAFADQRLACDLMCDTLPEAECTVGDTQCIEGAPTAFQRCNSDGEWTLVSCQENEHCSLDQCLPSTCLEGQTRCLNSSEVIRCEAGQWMISEQCNGGACSGGICQSLSCAQAAQERSYLGCEYLALELPNGVAGGDNVSATAVVVTNPSTTETAYVQLLAAGGVPTSLISQQTLIAPVDIEIPVGLYTNQTIRSEVKDAQGQVVESGVMRADQLGVPPGGIATLLLPPASWPEEGTMVRQVAHRVVSDHPIGAYQFNPYCCNFSFSNDASLLIPTSALGQEYIYLGAPTLHGATFFGEYAHPATGVIVAHRDQTVVRFTLPTEGILQVETEGRMTQERGAYTVTLNQQEALLLRLKTNPLGLFGEATAQPDLTGSFIQADQPVAVFSGHQCSYYPQDTPACDHLEEQLFPTDTWGSEFLLVPPKERRANSPNELVYWKIVAQSLNARLHLSAPMSELNAGGPGALGVPDCRRFLEADGQTIALGTSTFCEFATKRAVSLSADQGVMVMGILSGQVAVSEDSSFGTHLGDPAIFLLPPARQARRDYAFLTPDTYFSDFATLTFTEGAQITLDGQMLDLSNSLEIAGASQRYIHVELTDGPHQIQGSSPFGILVVAYDDFVSYAFTGGLNLSKR